MINNMTTLNNEITLTIMGRTCNPIKLKTGLPQGCPLSCMLYVLQADPFLEYVSTLAGVDRAVAFCDDFNIECKHTKAVQEVQKSREKI